VRESVCERERLTVMRMCAAFVAAGERERERESERERGKERKRECVAVRCSADSQSRVQ